MDALHDLVTGVLDDDQTLGVLEGQAREGAESERTLRRATDAIAEAAETDLVFAERLGELVTTLQKQEGQRAPGVGLSQQNGEGQKPWADATLRAAGETYRLMHATSSTCTDDSTGAGQSLTLPANVRVPTTSPAIRPWASEAYWGRPAPQSGRASLQL
jgi:hypothetical protein